MLAAAPIRARSWSLLAETEALAGAPERGRALAETALELKPTELLALIHRVRAQLGDGEGAEAVRTLNLALRRHGEQRRALLPLMAAALRTGEGLKAFAAHAADGADWVDPMLRLLPEAEDGVTLLYRTERALLAAGVAREDALNGSMRALHAKERSDLAYRLFLASLDPEAKARSGYVHDAGFEVEPSGRMHDWVLSDTAGVAVSWSPAEDDAPAGGTAGEGWSDARVAIRFGARPVQRIGLEQVLSLPPGQYRFTTRFKARDLVAPKGVAWMLRCGGAGTPFVLEIPGGTYDSEARSVEFTLPVACERSTLTLAPVEATRSFRHVYRGALDIHEARIERTGA